MALRVRRCKHDVPINRICGECRIENEEAHRRDDLGPRCIVILEFEWTHYDDEPWWKGAIFRSEVGGRNYTRVRWFCFALTFWKGNAFEYNEAIRRTEWVN